MTGSVMPLVLAATRSSSSGDSTLTTIVLIIVVVMVLALFAFASRFIGLWFQAYMSRANIRFLELIGMYFRKVDARTIVVNKVALVQAGLHTISTGALEAHYLAKGNVPNVVRSIIAADRADPCDRRRRWNERRRFNRRYRRHRFQTPRRRKHD